MDLVKLIEKIRKEHLYIQDERRSIHQLNIDINEKLDSTIKSMWIVKNQRYICDKLHVGHVTNDPINLINESNKIQKADFLLGHEKFGSDEVFLSNMLQHLRDNPKSISYLLFHAEKECTNFLDLLCKIIISTVYNPYFLDQDKLSLIDIMEELIEIYVNFYDDLRRHLHNKNSSFGIVYRYFCDELLELKTFYKLVLSKTIMLVLSEDNLFLDIDPNRAVMRFSMEERQKHFGSETSEEYEDNLKRYQKWTIQKLKYFVNQFIKSLRENIHAFPQSLILLIVRMYAKLIERFEYQKVIAIFVDMIFFFLICPAIQNPDLFGITDLHINHIAHYNLMQCAQIIQMLALSNWEKVNMPYQEVCDLFDRNCLAFIIEHIFTVAKSTIIPKSFDQTITQLPHFYISDIELKFLLEFIKLFFNKNEQTDNPLNNYFKKIPNSIMNFDYEIKQQTLPVKITEQSSNRLKKMTNLSKSNDFTEYNCLDEFSSLNIKNLLANNAENWPTLKALFNAKRIYKISNYDFQTQFIGLKSEEKLLNSITDKHSIVNENVEKLFEEIDEFLNLEIEHQIPSLSIDEAANKMASFCCFNNVTNENNDNNNNNLMNNKKDDLLLNLFDDNIIADDESFAEMNMQSLGTLTLHLGDFIDDHLEDNNQQKLQSNDKFMEDSLLGNNSKQNTTTNNPMGKKVLTGFKNIKDKMKNISLNKDNNKSQTSTSNNNSNNSQNDMKIEYSNDVINININKTNIKAETDEIFGKYRSNVSSTNNNANNLSQNLIHLIDKTDNDNDNDQQLQQHEYDPLFDIRSKLCKLFCTIDIAYLYRRHYHFLKLSEKNEFVMFLNILLSYSDDSNDDVSTPVLIMDILRILQQTSQQEFVQTFQQIENDWKCKNIYKIYLIKSRQYLLQKLQRFESVYLSSLKKEQSSTDFIIISFLIRMILEQKQKILEICELIKKFRNPTTLQDEKASLVKMLINETIENNLKNVRFTEDQSKLVKQILERHLMNRIYLYAFYPNGDIDHMRDQILFKQITQLSNNLSHNSKLLNIPSKYFTTSPWPSAQTELLLLSAYKTPRDKVQCIYRCCLHIMTLLNTSQNSIPSADDLFPVLIFVVIKSNPKSILSTIQYVNTFYLNDMTGEYQYYWTQFCSAVEFIKTILNS